jgi:hypothetical protein
VRIKRIIPAGLVAVLLLLCLCVLGGGIWLWPYRYPLASLARSAARGPQVIRSDFSPDGRAARNFSVNDQ